jgi:plastocyanin
MRKSLAIISITAVALVLAIVCSARTRLSSGTSSAVPAANATVKISNFQFTPKVLTVAPGATVEWVNEAGRHTVEADDGSFKSDVLKQGDKFAHKFDKAGTYAYHCEFHGEKGGKDMAGKIVVRGK